MRDVQRPIEILLVDDNPCDVEMTQLALSDSKICNNIHVVNDGQQAIDFLNRREPYTGVVSPDVILLDLHMPKMDGKELLDIIKNDAGLSQIPIAILTSSEAEKDIVKSYRLHANCYINKPVNLERFLEMVKAIEGFWLSVVKLPDRKKSRNQAA